MSTDPDYGKEYLKLEDELLALHRSLGISMEKAGEIGLGLEREELEVARKLIALAFTRIRDKRAILETKPR